MATIALCLMTCGRVEMTEMTVRSFAAHNDVDRFVRLHADDASDDPAIVAIARSAGFETVVQTSLRMGVRLIRTALIERAAKQADWIFVLENDIETLRAFPWALFEHVAEMAEVSCLRLYGRYKDGAGLEPCLTTHKRDGHQPVAWRPLKHAPEPAQIGRIHWSAQPAVTRSADLLALHRTGAEPRGLTVRVKKNVTAHIGATDRTPGRML